MKTCLTHSDAGWKRFPSTIFCIPSHLQVCWESITLWRWSWLGVHTWIHCRYSISHPCPPKCPIIFICARSQIMPDVYLLPKSILQSSARAWQVVVAHQIFSILYDRHDGRKSQSPSMAASVAVNSVVQSMTDIYTIFNCKVKTLWRGCLWRGCTTMLASKEGRGEEERKGKDEALLPSF